MLASPGAAAAARATNCNSLCIYNKNGHHRGGATPSLMERNHTHAGALGESGWGVRACVPAQYGSLKIFALMVLERVCTLAMSFSAFLDGTRRPWYAVSVSVYLYCRIPLGSSHPFCTHQPNARRRITIENCDRDRLVEICAALSNAMSINLLIGDWIGVETNSSIHVQNTSYLRKILVCIQGGFTTC